jgi:hypothetical protein
MRKYRQVLLFSEDLVAQEPCQGCKARNYDEGRFFKQLGCCVYCAVDHDAMRKALMRELPKDVNICEHPPRSKQRLAKSAERFKNGLSLFNPDDYANGMFESPTKRRGEEGETGVERSGNRWRARTFWRGKKWLLGTYDLEEEATSRCREWWKIHKGVDVQPPAMWMPCCDDDRAFAIEHEHIRMWQDEFPGVDSLGACEGYMMELRKARKKPTQVEVWNELTKRLQKIFGRRKRVTEVVGHNEQANHEEVAA